MMEVTPKHKLCGLFPVKDWKNPTRHISALVKGGKIIAYGESSLGGKLIGTVDRGRSCHSEISVLKKVTLNLKNKRKMAKYTVWNIRWTRKGTIANSKPCLNCQKVMLKLGIKNIVFSTDSGTFIKCKLSRLVCTPSSGFRY
tara:strand:- start:464 stop:889 length:426 start_codon:yes stop_codon:yes gene_type:complete